jgi:hypothetical protein
MPSLLECFDWVAKNPTVPIILGSAALALRTYITTRHLTRAKHTIDFETAYHQSQSLTAAIAKLGPYLVKASAEDLELLAITNNPDQEILPHIREVLNTWERAAIAVKRNVYDEDLLFDAYGSSLVYMWQKLIPFIRRRQSSNNRLYANFDWLAIRWLIRRDSIKNQEKIKKLKKALEMLREI